jgi:transcriptional regulator with XRE-family HTH domain
MNTGDKIKYYRTLRGFSQKKLAQLSGVSEGAIRKYEAETRNPKPSQLSAIANALGIDEFIFSDFSVDTPARVMSLLFLLEKNFEIEFDGEKDKDGNMIPQTIKLYFSNAELNQRIANWSVFHSALKSVKREDYESKELFEVVYYSLLEKYEKAKLMLADSNRVVSDKNTKIDDENIEIESK